MVSSKSVSKVRFLVWSNLFKYGVYKTMIFQKMSPNMKY